MELLREARRGVEKELRIVELSGGKGNDKKFLFLGKKPEEESTSMAP
jgi:hypothetical protein